MLSADPRLRRARSQGLVAVVAIGVAVVAFGWLFGDETVRVPGLVGPIPAVRIFPAVVAALGALCLLEPWHAFEVAGARSLARRRTFRWACGGAVTVLAGGALSWNAGVPVIVVLALLLYAALAVAVGYLGRHGWVLGAVALYGQLFVQQYDQFRPPLALGIAAVLVAWPCYLFRGEANLGRSPT